MLTDERGNPIALGSAIASGGEGSVHHVIGEPTLVAKIYKKTPSKQTAEKLKLMISLSTPEVRSISAWPTRILIQNGQVTGFLMPKLERFEPVHHLYNPAQRLKYFPRFGWRFIVHAARNCAAAFDEVHKTGCLVGDVNQSNILVNIQGEIRLIDCDSFQVSSGGRSYLCEVGVAHYTAPELHGQNLNSAARTLNHDRFGLAVLLFQFLFVGRHPYAGVYLGPGDLAFEDAIREFRFAYGPRKNVVQMEPPPFTLNINDIPPGLASLFCRAFERGSEGAGIRPTALEWFNALGHLAGQITNCLTDRGHEYWAGSKGCVWCQIASANGPDFFFGVGDSPTTFTLDEQKFEGYYNRLKAARLLDFPYDRESYKSKKHPVPEDLPENLDNQQSMMKILAVVTSLGFVLTIFAGPFSKTALLTGLLITLVFGIWSWVTLANSPYRRELNRRRIEQKLSYEQVLKLEDQWERIMADYANNHHKLTQNVQTQLNQCRNLNQEYAFEHKSLESRREELARVQYLKSCFIADADDIPNIKEGRKQTLALYQIHTANDISFESVMRIPRFGEKLAFSLVAWREQMNAQFRFDRSKGVPEADLRGLATKFRKRQEGLFRNLEQMITELEALMPRARGKLTTLIPEIRSAIARWWQADTDLQFLQQRK